MGFEWDQQKAATNLRKHGVDFAEAVREQEMKKEYDFTRAVRGPVLRLPPGKTRITIRIDDDVLRWFRTQVHAAGGGSYQGLMNAALREYLGRRKDGLEDTLRIVIREELGRYEVKPAPVAPPRSNKRMQRTRSAKARRRGPRS